MKDILAYKIIGACIVGEEDADGTIQLLEFVPKEWSKPFLCVHQWLYITHLIQPEPEVLKRHKNAPLVIDAAGEVVLTIHDPDDVGKPLEKAARKQHCAPFSGDDSDNNIAPPKSKRLKKEPSKKRKRTTPFEDDSDSVIITPPQSKKPRAIVCSDSGDEPLQSRSSTKIPADSDGDASMESE